MANNSGHSLEAIITQARACTLCQDALPHPPRPVLRAKASARILIVGQAPGLKVHSSGTPWDDPSGDRLRRWMNLDKNQFYDEQHIAIVPMGFCYPGKGRNGDLPPRKECASTWHHLILSSLPDIQLTLLVGQYAQKYYLRDTYSNLTETVKHWQHYLPTHFVLPHPSPRNQIWLKRNPWFNQTVVPELQNRIAQILDT